MKLIAYLIATLAATSASQIFSQPQAEHYDSTADIYQSAAEYQQQGVYADQSHSFPVHDVTYNQRPSEEKNAKILAYQSESDGHNYHYGYETENGIKAQEVGNVKKGTQVEGVFSYKGDDGHTYTMSYSADEHGFRAYGSHLPTPPPIPEAILKSLEQNAKDEAKGIFDDGHYHKEHQATQNNEHDGYQQQAYQQEAYQQKAYQQEAYQQEAYQQEAYQQEAYQQEAYRSAPVQIIMSSEAEYHH